MGNRTSFIDGVRPASNTSIEIDFYFGGKRCRERIKLQPTPANLKKAALHRAAILNSIANGSFDYTVTFPNSKHADTVPRPACPLTVASYLEQWLDRIEPFLKASTHNGYRKIIANQLVPALGTIPLVELTRKQVKDFATALMVTPKTLGNIISPLRTALDDAVEDELVSENPLANWKIRRRRGAARQRDHVDPFAHAEREAILDTLTGQARNLIRFAFWTGMRTSELVALDWNDVDFVRGTVFVTKARTQTSKVAEETKTDAGERQIKVLPEALQALRDQKLHTWLKGEEVFQNPRTLDRWAGDQPIRKTMWQPALKRAGVRYRNPYQTRHTFASMALMAGESVQWVASQMGHTDWTFTARTYTRYIPEDAPDAGSKLVEMHRSLGQRLS